MLVYSLRIICRTFKDGEFCRSEHEFESLFVEIEIPNQHNIISGVIYRHPKTQLRSMLDFVHNTVDRINKENKYCLLLGDFNIDLLKFDSHPGSEEFTNTLGSFSFHPQILKPTRITHHSATLIDNIFFNSLEHHTISGNILSGITDHLPNFIIINKFSALPKNVKIYKRDYSNLDKDALASELSSIDWNEVFVSDSEATNVNTLFQSFYSRITEVIDKHVPVRKLTRKEIKSLSKPWVTFGIKTTIRVKQKLYEKYLKSGNSYYLTKYKYYRNKVSSLIKHSKQEYYNDYFKTNSKNIRNIWKGIKQLITLKPRGVNLISKISHNNQTITDPKAIANAFNKHFSNIGERLAGNMPDAEIETLDFTGLAQPNSFCLSPETTIEIEEEISNLNSSKAVRPFSIPVYLIKLLKTYLSIPLETIFNLSFNSGCVPDHRSK